MRQRQHNKSHRVNRRTLFFGVLLLILSIVAPTSYADNLIVLSRQLDIYQQVAQKIDSDLESPSQTIDLSQLSGKLFKLSNYDNIIAVGSKAGDVLFSLAPAEKNLYITFLPKQTYQALLTKYKGHTRIRKKTVTAVYLDQPINRQLRLAKLLIKDATAFATALGPTSKTILPDIQKAAKSESLNLNHILLTESDNPIHKLQSLVKGSGFFLALADKSVFNRSTAKWILYISFRQRIPLIAFSKKYVDAGALAAVFSSPKQIGRHTAETIRNTKNGIKNINGQYPRYFSIALNPTAAKSLRIKAPSVEQLEVQLRELEQ